MRGAPGDVDATVELRESVFKVAIAIALALADADASPLEDDRMNTYFEALGLDPARAEVLAKEARKPA